MSLVTRKLSILLCGLVWTAACANELPEPTGGMRGGAGTGPVAGAAAPAAAGVSQVAPGLVSAPASGPASAAAASTAAVPAAVAATGGAVKAAPAAVGGSAAAPMSASGTAGAPAPASQGAAGEAALPDLTQFLPPLSTPESRIPSPSNPAECPAVAPEDPIGDCLGLPIYVECNYGTYSCICDWYHWLCAG